MSSRRTPTAVPRPGVPERCRDAARVEVLRASSAARLRDLVADLKKPGLALEGLRGYGPPELARRCSLAVRLSELLRDVPEPLRSEWGSRPLEEWERLCGSLGSKGRRPVTSSSATELAAGTDRRPVSAPAMGETRPRLQPSSTSTTPTGAAVGALSASIGLGPAGAARQAGTLAPLTPTGSAGALARRAAAVGSSAPLDAQRQASPACTAAFDLLDKWVRAMRPLAPCGTLPSVLAELVHGTDAELPEDPPVADCLKRLVPHPDALVAAGGRWRYLEDILDVAKLEDQLRPEPSMLAARRSPFNEGVKERRSRRSPSPSSRNRSAPPGSGSLVAAASSSGASGEWSRHPLLIPPGRLREVGVTRPVRRATNSNSASCISLTEPGTSSAWAAQANEEGEKLFEKAALRPLQDPWPGPQVSTRLQARPLGPGAPPAKGPGDNCPRIPQQGPRGPRLAPRGSLLRRSRSAASLTRAQRMCPRQQLMIECTGNGGEENPSMISPESPPSAGPTAKREPGGRGKHAPSAVVEEEEYDEEEGEEEYVAFAVSHDS